MSLKKINNLMNQNKNPRIKFFKLNKYAKKISSQFGEDGIIEYYTKISRLRINKSCVEFGSHEGIRIEKFIKPNARTKSNLDKSGLFY